MAELVAIGDPVNDGERLALSCLRDELPADWSLVANFSFVQGKRPFECDVLAVGPAGWGYLAEVKAWSGRIRGNDSEWELPPLAGDQPSYRPNPFNLVEQKAKALASLLREEEQPLKAVYIAPLVVLVSEESPELDGRCAEWTVLLGDAASKILADPRPFEKKPPADAVARVVDALTKTVRPIAPAHVAGNWRLIELVESGPSWEIWSARSRLGGENSRLVRMKRYLLDPLLTGTERELQRDRARRDLEALERLAGTDGAVPPVSTAEDDGEYLLVVTDWPNGESLSSLVTAGGLTSDSAEDVFEALVTAVASVHRVGIVHRQLSPRCAHYLADGRVVLTDFDYARIPAAASITEFIAEELDSPFTAPEVSVDPAATSKASDVWSVGRIGLALFGCERADDAPARIREILKRALSPEPTDRPQDAEILLADLYGEGGDLFDRFEPDDELDDRWVIRPHPVAEGGIARVYKVFDTLVERYYAAKFVKPEYRHLIDPAEEYRLLIELPDHPGLVKPEMPREITRYRRGKRQREHHDVFVPTRWIDGPRLDQLLAEKLPSERCIELILAISEAVAHLHRHHLLHRDLKPQNVIVEQPSGEPLVVDFNVSRHEDKVSQTKTGTEPYRPPDLAETGWNKGADVFALGVILCELTAGGLLHGNCRTWLADAPIHDSLRAFLDRATSEHATDRFAGIPDFTEALRRVASDLSQARQHVDAADFPTAEEDELSRENWNPYQTRLVGLFSQSRSSNAGTRGLDEFGRWAYVETLIDRLLFQDIIDGQHSLVVITGNAGDGKTAFIQVLEQRLAEHGGRVSHRPEGNGASIEWRDRRFITNWDGSQDEGSSENDQVLDGFFAPFAGEDPAPDSDETRIIAINEGRMIDFLVARREQFPWLSTAMLDLFNSEVAPTADWLTVVNLNLRALTILEENGNSLVRRLLEKFSDDRLWQPCRGCLAAEHCYARANAEVVRDPVLGGRVSERIRETLEVARLRRRLHITMRDLRSALAFAVAGNRTCDEIVGLVKENDGKSLLAGHIYNSIFGGNQRMPPPAASAEAGRDRLLAVTGTLDVALTANPGDDARLWTLGSKAIRADPAGVSRSDRERLDQLRERLPNGATQLLDHQAKADLRLLHASLRRKLYFETEDPGWIGMLPYDRLDRFVRQLGGTSDEDRARLVRAISYSEGMFNDAFQDRLAVRLASDGMSAARSFVTHASSEFDLKPADRSSAARYVEYAPDSLRLSHRRHPDLSLEVDLDLYEMLSRILDGFTPSREEQRGAWLNLRIFKERLATFGADELLLTRDDAVYFCIAKDEDGAVYVDKAN
jgi:serine/threonine protein kinase